MDGIYERIWKGSLPGYISGKFTDRNVFYSSYLQTYIDRDVSELVALVDKLQFQDFIRAAACRAGQMLNIHDIAQDVGVSDAINGAILENYVVSEIIKTYHNAAQDCLLWYYRDKSSNGIDMVIENNGQLHPLEIKRSVNPGSELIGAFSVLDKGSVPRGKGALICMRPELSAINADNYIVPIWMI